MRSTLGAGIVGNSPQCRLQPGPFGANRQLVKPSVFSAKASKFKPVLRSFDRFGRRVDVVDYHDSYHALMRMGAENRVPSFAWGPDGGRPGSMVVRSALSLLHYQVRPCTPPSPPHTHTHPPLLSPHCGPLHVSCVETRSPLVMRAPRRTTEPAVPSP